MNRPFKSPVFYLSLAFAYLLFFMPLRGEINFWRPLLVFLVVLYWLRVEPHLLGVGFAWSAGLALDLLTDGPLGRNALAMGICAYVLQLAGQRLQHFSVWHQMVVVAALAFFYQLVAIVVSLIAGQDAERLAMLFPVLTTTLLWPLLAGLLWLFYKPE